MNGPIGIFDSGLGGLTVSDPITKQFPGLDMIYLGDNARTPYGPRSQEIIYRYTLQGVRRLFEMGCPLVILACNTASARALRQIQRNDLEKKWPGRRVLGVIRPSAELAAASNSYRTVAVAGTAATV